MLSIEDFSQLEGAVQRSPKYTARSVRRHLRPRTRLNNIEVLLRVQNLFTTVRHIYQEDDIHFGFIQTFKTLSGLAQHLVAKSCVGGASTLREVAAYLEDRLQQIGRPRFISKIRHELWLLL